MNRSNPLIYVRTMPKHGAPVDISQRITQLTYEDDSKKTDKLTITVENWDLANFDDPLLAKGVVLEVRWGYAGNMTPARQCVIQKVTGGQVLTVTAMDKGILMAKETKSRGFERMTRSDVVKKIAKENGYDDRHIQETTHVHEHIYQARLTDAAFLKEMAKLEGFEYFVDFDGLHWHPKNLDQPPAGEELVWFADRTGTLITFSIDNDVTAKPAVIAQKGRDPITKENFEVKGSDADTSRTGAAILEMIDPRTESTHDQVGSPAGMSVTSPATETNAAAAKAHVDGQFKQAQITLVELSGSIVGDPSFLKGTIRRISNIRSLSGNYYVTSVKHSVDASAFKIDFKAKRDGRSKAVGNQVKSEAKPNEQPAKNDDSLQPFEQINSRTQTTTETVWQDSRGRQSVK